MVFCARHPPPHLLFLAEEPIHPPRLPEKSEKSASGNSKTYKPYLKMLLILKSVAGMLQVCTPATRSKPNTQEGTVAGVAGVARFVSTFITHTHTNAHTHARIYTRIYHSCFFCICAYNLLHLLHLLQTLVISRVFVCSRFIYLLQPATF